MCDEFNLPLPPMTCFEVHDPDFSDWIDLESFQSIQDKTRLRVKKRQTLLTFDDFSTSDVETLFSTTAHSKFEVSRIEAISNPVLLDYTTKCLLVLENRRLKGNLFNPKLSD